MPGDKRPKVIVIAGPTASGKTALGVDLARAVSGEIVNADAMQVYRGMDIGTAKPTPEERKGIPHHLIDIVNPDEDFNAATFCHRAVPVVKKICLRGKTCLVVGGTGLYIRALTGGLIEAPPSDPRLRESLRLECETHGPARLHGRLAALDPERAKAIHPNDGVRIVRAMEINLLSKLRPSKLIKGHGFREQPFLALKLCLHLDREDLYHRINQRTVEMLNRGLIEETRGLLDRGYSPDLKSMKAIGYRHAIRHLQGKWSLEETVFSLKRDTRRYAKRQLTWFRGESGVIWVDPGDLNMVIEKVQEFLDKTG